MRLTAAVRESGVRCEGVNLFLADGEAAGQEIPHVHLHVLPRYEGDPFRIDREGGWQQAERPELDRTAEAIRKALAA
jgi:histidine triad (HIT) family protein